MAILKIISFDQLNQEHICEDEKGDKHRVDLLVSADLKVPDGKDWDEYQRELVGKVIQCRLLAFKEIAVDIEMICFTSANTTGNK